MNNGFAESTVGKVNVEPFEICIFTYANITLPLEVEWSMVP